MEGSSVEMIVIATTEKAAAKIGRKRAQDIKPYAGTPVGVDVRLA